MLVRIISAVVASALGITVLCLSSSIVVEFALAFLAAVAVFELFSSVGISKTCRVFMIATMILSALIQFSVRGLIPCPMSVYGAAFLIVFIITVIANFGKIGPETLSVAAVYCCIITVGLASLGYILNRKYGLILLILALLSAWLTDSGAYFIGCAFGKHKLAPVLSPKKTVEGAIGGVVVCITLSTTFLYLYQRFVSPEMTVSYATVALLILICSLLSMAGDLFASAIKRYYNIKDYGNIMPGHGGVIDRFDSVFVVAPIFATAVSVFSVIS